MRCTSVLLTILLPMVIAACGGGGDQPMAPMPAFGAGDTYSFDDGTVRRVEYVRGDTVVWRDQRDLPVVTSRDVLLPPSEQRAAGAQVRRRLATQADLFPLRPGRAVGFAASTEWLQPHAPPRIVEERWTCAAGGRVPVQTQAGTFDTVRVDCQVQEDPDGRNLTHTFFYAPTIGFYVRRVDSAPGNLVHTATLTGFTEGEPPLTGTALNQRLHAIKQALEQQLSGQWVPWTDRDSGAGGSVEPVFTVRSERNGWCREFRETLQTAGRSYDLLGTACREPTGIWQVQQVTPNRIAAR